MDQFLLRAHKRKLKRLPDRPVFKAAKRGQLPKPLHKLGGPRVYATPLVDVGDNYRVCFVWRNGHILSDTAFYGWLFEVRPQGLYPLANLHYHPSHKPVHLLTPCRSDRDFINRQLPGAQEFNFHTPKFDPREELDRLKLVELFCNRCGILLGEEGLLP